MREAYLSPADIVTRQKAATNLGTLFSFGFCSTWTVESRSRYPLTVNQVRTLRGFSGLELVPILISFLD